MTDRFELVAPLLPPVERLLPDIERALASRWLTNGPFVRRLEDALGPVLGIRHAVAVASGTLGLMVAIRALGWKGEVITPSFSFAGTVHALRWCGCEPVFAEVDRDSFLLDPESVGRMVGPGSVGVLAVDAYGVPADVDALADAVDLPILADGAHGLGSARKGDRAPVARVFSMHPTKTLVAGEGGIIATDDADLAERLRSTANFAFGEGQDATDVGLNAKMPELSAILAYHQIDLLGRTVEGRARWDAVYREALDDVAGISFQRIPPGVRHNFQYTPVVIDAGAFGRSRDEVAAHLLERGIVTRPYFSPPVHRMRVYRGAFRADDLGWTERLSDSVLCLPVHPGESEAGASRVAEMIRALADRRGARTRTLGTEADVP